MQEIKDCATVVNQKREEIGLTVRALSRRTGISENALYGIFAGNRKMRANELLSLSSVLNLSFDDYLSESNEEKTA